MKSTPFEILGVPVTFAIDEKHLHKRMIELAAANHPDRFEDPLDQADAAERSAAINQAYGTLKDPMSRAQILLTLLGEDCQWDEKALPANLLMEMMETHEDLQDAIESGDAQAVDRHKQWALQQQTIETQELARLIGIAAESPAGPPRQATIQDAQIKLNTLRYLARMLEQVPE